MLVVGVRVGREVIVGDHTVVTVSSIDRANQEVKLGFDSEHMVNRVNDPETTMKAAKIKARTKRGLGKKFGPMKQLDVHVASYVSDGEPQMKAALTKATASFPGANMAVLSNETKLSLASHQFVVVRSATDTEANILQKFAKDVAGWPVLDELEAADSTIYTLMIRTLAEKVGGDVEYFDTLKA